MKNTVEKEIELEKSPISKEKPPVIRERSKRNSNPIASLLSGGPLEITVKIPEDDKAALIGTVNAMADKMDFRWKRTQQLIIIGYVMTSCSFIISKII
jgi:hypothetical protein